ncbi:5'/3'-nucleotidase SurE [Desulfuribacillus alkaliarsenatis]|uniref:5'-nucleotidase SurE n=1 Tax=Desulfuribacillus alkaliarsenatis TaxID=766136 RepID=A0A1E5FZI3_9FIRM|nr:5'/3'-nucleotidase SurE [Desulfuribacillus alkaliarsenatis]OEF95987.1 5'/3'-nucleotidase SurE [Desulfuribacillus alkaliarsenatis]
MDILVTNDDGIHAKGLKALVKELSKIANVYVIAPDRERSATGHAITIHSPIRTTEVPGFTDATKAFQVDGTPADCVKLGISTLLDNKPDFVVSGINAGPNLGLDVLYSGTVAAAIEASIHEIPGIAFSLAGSTDFCYDTAAKISIQILKQLMEKNLDNNSIFNVNLPVLADQGCKGIVVTTLGIRKYINFYEQRSDPRGLPYYWLAGDLMDHINKPDTDVNVVDNGYVSITPINLDFTHYQKVKEMKDWNFKF